MIINFTNR